MAATRFSFFVVLKLNYFHRIYVLLVNSLCTVYKSPNLPATGFWPIHFVFCILVNLGPIYRELFLRPLLRNGFHNPHACTKSEFRFRLNLGLFRSWPKLSKYSNLHS